MFVKITTSGPRRYVQLVESFRNEAGLVRKRTVATLGVSIRSAVNSTALSMA